MASLPSLTSAPEAGACKSLRYAPREGERRDQSRNALAPGGPPSLDDVVRAGDHHVRRLPWTIQRELGQARRDAPVDVAGRDRGHGDWEPRRLLGHVTPTPHRDWLDGRRCELTL